jgi:hypothetical protein
MASATLSDVNEQLVEQNGLLEKVQNLFTDFFNRQARDKLDLLEMVREMTGTGNEQQDNEQRNERNKEKDGSSFMDGLFGTILKAGMFAGFGTLLYNSFRDELGLPALGDVLEGTVQKVSTMMIKAANTFMPEDLQIKDELTTGEIGAGVAGAVVAGKAAGMGVRAIKRNLEVRRIEKTVEKAVAAKTVPVTTATQPVIPPPTKIKASDVDLTGKDALDKNGNPLKGAAANSRKQALADKTNTINEKRYADELEKQRTGKLQTPPPPPPTEPVKDKPTTKTKIKAGGGVAGIVAATALPYLIDPLKEATGAEKGSFTDASIDIGSMALQGATIGATLGSMIPIPGVGTLAGGAIGTALGAGYGVYDKLFSDNGEKLENLNAEQREQMAEQLDEASMEAAQPNGAPVVYIEGDKNTTSTVHAEQFNAGKNDMPSPKPGGLVPSAAGAYG